MKTLDLIRDRLRPPLLDRIVFLHVPKCGGTAVERALQACYKPWRATQRDSIGKLDEEAARAASIAGGVSYNDLRRAMLAFDLSTTMAYLLTGHYRYADAVVDEYRADWSFITVLRHPIDRWYSHYSYNTTRPADSQYHISLPLEEYVESERAALHGTGLTRSFADLDDPGDARSPEAVERAIRHLRKLDIVGALEDLPAFAAAFEKRFGHPLEIPRLNVTPAGARRSQHDVDPVTADRIRQFCEPDLAVYRAFFPELASDR